MPTECSCVRCQSYCTHKPGWFKPDQIEPLAKFLGISVEELFKTQLMVDWWEAEPNIFLLSPAIVGEIPGDMFPSNPGGRCIFFKEGRCSIHPVKPFECRECDHATDPKSVPPMREALAESWKPHQEWIKTLLGREPESQIFSIFDALKM